MKVRTISIAAGGTHKRFAGLGNPGLNLRCTSSGTDVPRLDAAHAPCALQQPDARARHSRTPGERGLVSPLLMAEHARPASLRSAGRNRASPARSRSEPASSITRWPRFPCLCVQFLSACTVLRVLHLFSLFFSRTTLHIALRSVALLVLAASSSLLLLHHDLRR